MLLLQRHRQRPTQCHWALIPWCNNVSYVLDAALKIRLSLVDQTQAVSPELCLWSLFTNIWSWFVVLNVGRKFSCRPHRHQGRGERERKRTRKQEKEEVVEEDEEEEDYSKESEEEEKEEICWFSCLLLSILPLLPLSTFFLGGATICCFHISSPPLHPVNLLVFSPFRSFPLCPVSLHHLQQIWAVRKTVDNNSKIVLHLKQNKTKKN